MNEFIKQTAEKWFTKERVDTYSINSFFYLIIHFPIIEITNRDSCSHTIHDLYIRFEFTREQLISLKGMRGTTCKGEDDSHYLHSHLQTGVRGCLGNFCFGETILSELYIELSDEFNEEKFEIFLSSLDQYLEWESIAGTPYCNLTDITKSFQLPYATDIGDPTDLELSKIANLKEPLGLDLQVNPTTVRTLIDSGTLEKALENIEFDSSRYSYTQNGRYYVYVEPTKNSNEFTKSKVGESDIIFKEKKIPLNVLVYTQDINSLKKVINPYFLTNIKNYIEKDIQTIAEEKLLS